MIKIKLIHSFKKNINDFFLYLNLIFIYLLVSKYANFLEPFEDEITSLISGVSFLQNLNFNGSPLIEGNYSPYLTSGPIASIGSGFGWILTKNFVFARIFNFYFLVLLIYFLLKLSEIFKNNSRFFNLNLILISLTLLPWWFGSLYSLGEMFSSALFVVSILIINSHKNLAFFIMGFSIIFGKLIQILLVVPFIFIYLLSTKKLSFINIFNLLLPFLIYISLIFFKTENFNFVDYFTSYLSIIYNHQSSGLKINGFFNLQNILNQLNSSEFIQWSLITKVRVFITPLIFIFILYSERKKIDKLLNSSYAIIFSILTPYLWFLFLSQTKWIRYSQHFLFLIIFFSLIILFSEIELSSISVLVLLFNISLFLSSELVLILFLCTLFKRKDSGLFKKLILIVLVLNTLNLLIESQNLTEYDLNLESCKNSLTSMKCVEDYLPYNFFNNT